MNVHETVFLRDAQGRPLVTSERLVGRSGDFPIRQIRWVRIEPRRAPRLMSVLLPLASGGAMGGMGLRIAALSSLGGLAVSGLLSVPRRYAIRVVPEEGEVVTALVVKDRYLAEHIVEAVSRALSDWRPITTQVSPPIQD